MYILNDDYEMRNIRMEWSNAWSDSVTSICLLRAFNKRLALVSDFSLLILVVILTVLMKANEGTT